MYSFRVAIVCQDITFERMISLFQYPMWVIEVRDLRTGYLVPVCDGPGAQVLTRWAELLGRRRRRRRQSSSGNSG